MHPLFLVLSLTKDERGCTRTGGRHRGHGGKDTPYAAKGNREVTSPFMRQRALGPIEKGFAMGIEVVGIFGLLLLIADIWAIVSVV